MARDSMNSWITVAQDSLSGARDLHDANHPRSSISRAYYASYAIVTAALISSGADVSGARGKPNPDHAQLATLALHNLDHERFTIESRKLISRNLRQLRGLRETADYDPDSNITTQDAVHSLRCAHSIAREIERS